MTPGVSAVSRASMSNTRLARAAALLLMLRRCVRREPALPRSGRRCTSGLALADRPILVGPPIAVEIEIGFAAKSREVEIGPMHDHLVLERLRERGHFPARRDDAGSADQKLSLLQSGFGGC